MPANGYAWWYFDGMSADGEYGVVVIAFVGSVFSPYYFAARRARAEVDPMDFCAINVALYHKGKSSWCFTERPRTQVFRSSGNFGLGDNQISRTPERVLIDIDELAPRGETRIKGRLTIHPRHTLDRRFDLDGGGRHRWRPIAPVADITARFDTPNISFEGSAYMDANDGDEPIETTLMRWNWSRYHAGNHTIVLYDGYERDHSPFSLGLRFTDAGEISTIAPPPVQRLPRTFGWLCPRATRCDDARSARVHRTLENSPFYSRSIVETQLHGEQTLGVHESLALDRFTTRWMQKMLPFRIERIT